MWNEPLEAHQRCLRAGPPISHSRVHVLYTGVISRQTNGGTETRLHLHVHVGLGFAYHVLTFWGLT